MLTKGSQGSHLQIHSLISHIKYSMSSWLLGTFLYNWQQSKPKCSAVYLVNRFHGVAKHGVQYNIMHNTAAD